LTEANIVANDRHWNKWTPSKNTRRYIRISSFLRRHQPHSHAVTLPGQWNSLYKLAISEENVDDFVNYLRFVLVTYELPNW